MKLLRFKVLDDNLLISEGIETSTPSVTDEKVIMLSVASTITIASVAVVVMGIGMTLGWQYSAYLLLGLGAKVCLKKLDEMQDPAQLKMSASQYSAKYW